ncbi:MAG: Manganese-dependent protein-tyrosine phosphatase [uncultured Solirubrobacterales bacterium]|uniref:protein-tyrosine-phosphatase n=1 Tax=uncultured Solirubrobacterales bacterium TaxID=768556 RepID=A0A6J4TCX4_9ACTN|nr:MAG: Manganese-dependent protein-tyrosine phosphatase [uncultured Solirubrobacterales bacterium]
MSPHALRTEIHCHLLPGVDDGARDLDDSLEMAALATADGTATIVVTPHVRRDFVTDVSIVTEGFEELCEAVERAGIEVELHRGGELGHDLVGRLGQSELEAIAVGPPGRRWLLVEAPFEGLDRVFSAATDELRSRGFGIVIAHPERARGLLAGEAGGLSRELETGSLLQVNHWSLTGGHGAEAEHAALELLDRGLIAALASDAHPGWRRPTLSLGAAAAVAAGADARTAAALVSERPARMLRKGVASRTLAPLG